MKSFLRSRLSARLFAIVFGLGCASSLLAQPLPFNGRWLLDDRLGTQAPYAIMTIKGERMSWSGPAGSAPGCVQEFVLQKENPGTVYTNGHGTKFVAGLSGSLPTYLLKLGAGTCASTEEEMRISFPFVYDRNHIELVGYAKGKPISSRRFRRKQ